MGSTLKEPGYYNIYIAGTEGHGTIYTDVLIESDADIRALGPFTDEERYEVAHWDTTGAFEVYDREDLCSIVCFGTPIDGGRKD
jgi:hypothetical protein